MAENKKDRVRMYLLLGMSIVLIVVVYFRFIQKKNGEEGTLEPSAAAAAHLEIPEVEFDSLPTGRWGGLPVPQVPRDPFRDLFLPGRGSVIGEGDGSGTPESVSVASLKLRGVVMGGGKPVALINDEFLRLGDTISEYQVIRIDEKEVLLDSGIEIFRLRIEKRD
jgi:hypothetical protein